MKMILKWIGIGLGGLLGLLLVASVVLYFIGSSRLNKSYEVQGETIAIPNSEEAIARGKHLSQAVTLCQECHGEDLEGEVIDDEPLVSLISASNLTLGQGGVGASYNDADWVRAIRHGINSEGRGIILMHSDKYHHLSQEDLGAIIAFVKSVSPVDKVLPETKAGLLGKILVALGVFDAEDLPLIPAEVIDHSVPFAESPAQGETAEYGQYLVSISICSMCHGSDMSGNPPLETGAPAAPDITADGELNGVSEQAFIDLFRTHGMEESDYMPWEVFANMTDEELGAIWHYLTSLSSN